VILGYVTGGFGYHALDDAIRVLAEIGYQSVAITLDRHHLNPLDDEWPARARRIKDLLRRSGLRSTVETGARFLLDPRRKHQPTLVSADASDRGRRIEYLCRAVDVAVELDADCVSLWSGAADEDVSDAVLFDRLCGGLRDVLAHAEAHRVPLAFEPEPGMFVERMSDFGRLHEVVDHPLLGLTIDVGHVHCLADGDLLEHLRRWHESLLNVHLEDMRRGRHEHLFFGEGEVNFTEVINLLSGVGYRGPVHVELSRHSHNAPEVARRAHEFLSALWP
jgi:sugar phosphate isomerase/epimerase